MFEKMKLYNESDCQEISKKVLEKKDYFKRRYNGMFTLGAASYLDVSKYSPETTYLTDEEITNRLTKYNTLLQETFPELLETIRCFFEKELKCKCKYSKNLSYPGFHILESSREHAEQKNHEPHVDGQYETLMSIMNIKDINSEKLLSFTLPTALPQEGGGLRMWDWRYENNKEKSKSQIIKEIRKSKIVNIKYNEGEIIWHNGLNLHQIEAWKSNEKTMPRITMQGHGCLIEDTMYLYW